MIHWHLEKSLGGAGFAVWRGPLVSRPPPDRGVLIPDRSVPQPVPPHRVVSGTCSPGLNSPLPQAAATLGRGGPPLPQRTRWDLAGTPLSPPSSLPAAPPHPVRRGLPGAGIADPWARPELPSVLRRERAVGRKEASSESLKPSARRKCREFTPAWERAGMSVYHRVNTSRDGCLCVCVASMPVCGFLCVCACANRCVNL